MRLVIQNGIQYDADNLPAHVDASECIPIEEWFARNRTPSTSIEPDSVPAAPQPRRKPRKAR